MKNRSSSGLCKLAIVASVSAILAGCATTVSTERLVAPKWKESATLKRIAVLDFIHADKKDSRSTDAIQSAVGSIDLDGEKYFTVIERSRVQALVNEQKLRTTGLFDSSQAAKIGKLLQVQTVLLGTVDTNEYSADPYTGTEKVCVSRNPKGKCLSSKDQNVSCVNHTHVFSFIPKFISVQSAEVLFTGTYSAEATDNTCRKPGKSKVQLEQEARDSALTQFRQDIAPYKSNVDVPILVNYCTASSGLTSKFTGPCDTSAPPESVLAKVKGGAKFAKSGRMDRACTLWGEASGQHQDGFILPYLQGVCAELHDQNLPDAMGYYQRADSRTLEPVKAINRALSRVEAKMAQGGVSARSPASSSWTVTPSAKSAPRKNVPKPSPRVRSAQERLSDLGYDVGVADGYAGEKTLQAIRTYQADNGIAVSGKLDAETVEALGI